MAAVGVPALWIKHDELCGFGFGGNKVRGLEFIVADALAQGADVLVTGAGPQSNHVRATAAAAATNRLGCVAVFWGDEPLRDEGNLALTRMLGARTIFTHDRDRTSVDRALATVAADLRAEGRQPYVIPRGGACALGVLGHVLAVAEFMAQWSAASNPASHLTPRVFLAAGSGGTLAGWLLGRRLLGARIDIEAVTVSRPADELRARIRTLAQEAAALLGDAFAAVLRNDPLRDDEYLLDAGWIGEGYGIPTAEGMHAIRTAATSGGVFLDPTYTGKAFAALMDRAQRGALDPAQPLVFIHTGGEPALFAHSLAVPASNSSLIASAHPPASLLAPSGGVP